MKRYLQPLVFLMLSMFIMIVSIQFTSIRPSTSSPVQQDDYPITSWSDTSADAWTDDSMSQKEVLSRYGFENESPYYTYYNSSQEKQLELFLNKNTGIGCGFRYVFPEKSSTNIPEVYGFAFQLEEYSDNDDMWNVIDPTDPYSVKSIYSTDGSQSVENHKEYTAYNRDGSLALFQSTGTALCYGESCVREPVDIVKIQFSYRANGSLLQKGCHYNAQIFGTTYSDSTLHYDESERLQYAECYITHGELEYYYLYDHDPSLPAYCLLLDCGLGGCVPQMIRY